VSQVDYDNHSYNIHYMALLSKRADAVPLICLHGWPGCFLEFLPMATLLQSKYTPETLPYHFIVPSLPGYMFSSGPPVDRQDFSTYDVSCIFRSLFSQLGLSGDGATGYVVAGGDIGSRVARALAVDDPSCLGVHLNFCFDIGMHTFPRQELSVDDIHGLDKLDTFINTGAAYAQMHATRSATIGLVLSSSPVALLAWIGEKFGTWTDAKSTPDMKTILAFVTLYWLTDTFPRSIYPYRTDFSPREDVPAHGDSVRWRIPDGKAFGFSHFPHEILPVPRAWVERTGEVTFWREHGVGGHFAALEVGEALLGDLEEFVEQVREKSRS
jgi:microsomal epoxide hydrolase